MLQGEVGKNSNGDGEKYLLKALLNLLLYIGNSNDSEALKEFKDLVFTSGTNPHTDYSRPKIPMGG